MTLFHLNETTHFDQNNIILTKQWQKKKSGDLSSGTVHLLPPLARKNYSGDYIFKAFNTSSLHQIWQKIDHHDSLIFDHILV